MSKCDLEKKVTCRQILMRPNKVNRNGRVYPTTKNKGDDIMENKNNKNENNLSNEALNNLKDLRDSMNNLLDQFLNKADGNTKEPNIYNTCKCNNKQCECEKKNDPDQDEAPNVREIVERFADQIGESLGCKAVVISMDELEAMCNGCPGCDDDDAEDSSDEYDEIIDRLKHLEEGIRIILRGQSDSSYRSKPAVSSERVRKIERQLDVIIQMMYNQQDDLDTITKILNGLTAPKDTNNSKSEK